MAERNLIHFDVASLKAQSVGSPPGRGLPFDGVSRYWALIGNSIDPLLARQNIGNAGLEQRTGKKREGLYPSSL